VPREGEIEVYAHQLIQRGDRERTDRKPLDTVDAEGRRKLSRFFFVGV